MSGPRSTRGLFALWLSTGLGATALMAEIPVVIAAVARSADGGRALAALGIGLSIIVLVNSPALAVTELVVTTPEGQRPAGAPVASLSFGVGVHAAVLAATMAALPATGLPGVACAALATSAGLVAEVTALAVRSPGRHRGRTRFHVVCQ